MDFKRRNGFDNNYYFRKELPDIKEIASRIPSIEGDDDKQEVEKKLNYGKPVQVNDLTQNGFVKWIIQIHRNHYTDAMGITSRLYRMFHNSLCSVFG